jgi:pyruvate dehydrogenase E2 component (dihydrolipoamide acetyltransferase)
MLKEVILAKIGLTMETGRIIRWLKGEGDFVKQGDPLFEVETDKITTTVEAFHTGYLKKILVREGEEVHVNTVIAYIGEKGDEIVESNIPEKAGVDIHGYVRGVPLKEEPVKEKMAPRGKGGRVNASPLAKRLAAELGIELSMVKGSGPEGRIDREDVLAAAERLKSEYLDKTSLKTGIHKVVSQRNIPIVYTVPLQGIKKLVGKIMRESYLNNPHIHLETIVDTYEVSRLRDIVNKRYSGKYHITYTDIFVKAAAVALKNHPLLNASLEGDKINIFAEINIGVAVATEEGLFVPVIKMADKLSVSEISTELKKLTERIRTKKHSIDELSGGTFTVTNLGMFGITSFKPILNPPQAAILAVGAVRISPVVTESGEICARPLVNLSLGCDHRIVDGVDGARFLRDVKEIIERAESIFDNLF